MSYNLFLDDERYPKNVSWISLPLVEWTVVRNYDQFVKIITERGLPNNVSFDHDLADAHYQHYIETRGQGDPNTAVFKEKTGYECARWLKEYCTNNHLPIPPFTVHSMNPIGKQNIIRLLTNT